jgi:colanic acid/amylovoran biosynthesis glycosyltransferase
MQPPIALAYLLSQYPAVNHPFMLREVRRLRELGFDLRVASIRPPDRSPDKLTPVEREEAQSTFCVKRSGFALVLREHLATLLSRPAAYLSGLLCALRSGRHGILYFVEAVIVGRWMARNRLSHVHIHYCSTVGLIVTRIFPVTISVTFHGQAEFVNPDGFRLPEKIRASLFCRAISLYGRSQMLKSMPYEEWPKIEVSFLGVDTNEFSPRPFRAAPDPFQIACVGQLAPVKGQHMLVAAMEILVREGRRVILRIAGDGPDRVSLERDIVNRKLERHVVMEGFLNQDKLRQLYAACDVLALPSFAEGIPVVLMEAMAMEIPCVATWITGIPEIIGHETDGLLVPPGDAEALARAIVRLMDDSELRRGLGQRARLKILEKFDLRRNTGHLASVFRQRLASPASTAARL